MADKVKIIELDIDVESIIAKSAELKSVIDGLRADQASLKKSGDTSGDTFVKNAAQLTKLTSEYNLNQKQLANLATANGTFITTQDKLNALLGKEVVTIGEAVESNKALKAIRDTLNVTNEEEKKILDEINAKIDSNTTLIKDNVSENEKLKIGIGGYKDAVKEALTETGFYNGELNNLAKVYELGIKVISPFKNEISATAENMKASATETEGMSAAQKALTIATNLGSGAMRIFALAVAATGVGAIIIVIALLINYLRQLDPVMDAVEQAFAGLGGVIDFLTNTVGDFITNIKSAGDLLEKFGKFIMDPIGSIKALGKGMAEAAREAANLKEREQELADQMDINSIKNKKQESEIARLMIQAKDKSKSDAEQNKAFQDAEKLNADIFERNKKAATESLEIAIEIAKRKKQLSQEEVEALRNLDIERANAFLNEGKITTEAYERLKTSFEARIDVENQYNEQLDKITTKSNNAIEKQQAEAEARRQKAEEAKQKILDDAAALSKARLDLFLSEQGVRAKSLEEELRLNEKVYQAQLDIAKKEFEASEKTEADKLQLIIDSNNAKNDFLKSQAQLVVDNAQHELEAYIELNKSKIEENKFLTQDLVEEEKLRLDLLKQEEEEFQQTRLDNGVINEQTYLDAINTIREEDRARRIEIDEERAQAEADRQLIDIENQLATSQTNFDRSLALQIDRLNLQKAAELKNAEETGASKKLILEKYAEAEKEIRRTVENQKLSQISEAVGKAKGFFKEHTTAYKVMAIAEATINTYIAASNALKDYMYPVGGIMAGLAIAQGLLTVSQIVGIKLAKGAIDLNGPGSTTSDSIPAQLSRGESVINAESTKNNKSLLQAINANTGIDFANLLFPTSIAQVYNTASAAPIDYDLLSAKIAQANQSLPAPVVHANIDDIKREMDDKAAIIMGASF